MRVVVMSDTHAPFRWKRTPPALDRALRQCDLILHAGDVCVPSLLDELRTYAPVHAVLGNNDGPDAAAWGAPERWEEEIEGLHVAMVHDAGVSAGRAARVRRWFPTADLVVFGHSHIPLNDRSGPVHVFNPGSPTDKRMQPQGTYGVLEIDAGRLVSAQILSL